MTTTQASAPSATARRRNVALVAARVYAGLLGLAQLAGAFFFLVLAPEEAVWLGPWLDVPVVAAMLAGMLLKVTVACAPRLAVPRRVRLGLLAVTLGVAVTALKIGLYDEPEGVLFIGLDLVLLALLLLARRADRS